MHSALITYSTLKASCRVCRVPLTLRVHPDYAAMGHDPMRLTQLVVCNPCADLHNREARICDAIFNNCFLLLRKTTQDERVTLRASLETLTKKYAEVIAMMQHNDTILWETAFPEMLFYHPAQCPKILSKYRKDCATMRRVPTAPTVAALPYSDH